MFDRNYDVEIHNRSGWIGNNVELKYDIVCYTDGSRMESRKLTGASVFDKTHNKQHMFPLGKQTTVYQAVVYAIFRLDALALSVIATATWLGGWVAVRHSQYCIKTTKPIRKLFGPSGSPII